MTTGDGFSNHCLQQLNIHYWVFASLDVHLSSKGNKPTEGHILGLKREFGFPGQNQTAGSPFKKVVFFSWCLIHFPMFSAISVFLNNYPNFEHSLIKFKLWLSSLSLLNSWQMWSVNNYIDHQSINSHRCPLNFVVLAKVQWRQWTCFLLH